MPIGPPSHIPAPKSAWKPRPAPIVFTSVVELDSTGSVSTGVFQMLSAGSTGQPPIICWPYAFPASATPTSTSVDRRSIAGRAATLVPCADRRVADLIGIARETTLHDKLGASITELSDRFSTWRRASAFAEATADRRSLGGGWSALRASDLAASG